jgi:hypothetical protein
MTSLEAARPDGRFDAVVMLTWSDWKTEPRSNRYHYATRFARRLPVLFVQPDLEEATYAFEETTTPNLCILHIYRRYGERQRKLLARALTERRVLRPLLWAYNAYLADFFAECCAPLKVYHATEDYFVAGGSGNQYIAATLRRLLAHADLLVAVSHGVRDNYVKLGRYKGESLVLENGCDFGFWAETPGAPRADAGSKIAFYQGGINRRLDWRLLGQLVDRLPDWEFWFCGQAQEDAGDLRALQKRGNFRYLGEKSPEQLRDVARQCTLGLIPFVQEPYIKVSMPLKAFEYVACDLPVVSVPIDALRQFPALFALATDAEGFARGMERVAALRFDAEAAKQRAVFAERNGYEHRFRELVSWVDGYLKRPPAFFRANVLLLYDVNSTHVNTLHEHLSSFALFSRHNVFYSNATGMARCKTALANFDAVVIHYSVRVNLLDHLSPSFANALKDYAGLKVLFIQDEYDTTEIARDAIERLGIHTVFTCVPPEWIPSIYPPERFAHVDFIPTLTGYVPLSQHAAGKPLAERGVLIGYRGRALPYWYGELGQEKQQIGQRMRQECERRGLAIDIEWDDRHRIYGEGWYEFLGNARATLGTESGSNVFDDSGSIKSAVEAALAREPELSYEQAKQRFLAGKEGPVRMNQISPKIFEAIASRTALILYEGSYSGVVEPGRHYISLKKDFSNVDSVLARVQDDRFLAELTERAYQEIVASGKFSYETFVRQFDSVIAARARNRAGAALLGVVHARKLTADSEWRPLAGRFRLSQLPTTAPLVRSHLQSPAYLLTTHFGKVALAALQPAWHAIPRPIRRVLWPLVTPVLGMGRIAMRFLGRGR